MTCANLLACREGQGASTSCRRRRTCRCRRRSPGRALLRLAGADINDVGVRRRDGNGADRAGGLVVEDRPPGAAGVGGLPDAAVHDAHVEGVRLAGHALDRFGAAGAVRPDVAPAQFSETSRGRRPAGVWASPRGGRRPPPAPRHECRAPCESSPTSSDAGSVARWIARRPCDTLPHAHDDTSSTGSPPGRPGDCLAASAPGAAQQRAADARQFTSDDYARAEKWMSYNTTPLVANGRRARNVATRRSPVVSQSGGNRHRVHHGRLRARHAGRPRSITPGWRPRSRRRQARRTTATKLPFSQFTWSDDLQSFTATADGKRWTCDVQGKQCAAAAAAVRGGAQQQRVPRRQARGVHSRLQPVGEDVASGAETQLTTDGVKDYRLRHRQRRLDPQRPPDHAVVADSQKIATFQQDQRGSGEMYLVGTTAGHPQLEAWKYPLPGDNVDHDDRTRGHRRRSPHVVSASRCRPTSTARRSATMSSCCGGEWGDVQWHPDGSQIAFVSTSRDHKDEVLRVADAATGAVRDVMSEKRGDVLRIRQRPA